MCVCVCVRVCVCIHVCACVCDMYCLCTCILYMHILCKRAIKALHILPHAFGLISLARLGHPTPYTDIQAVTRFAKHSTRSRGSSPPPPSVPFFSSSHCQPYARWRGWCPTSCWTSTHRANRQAKTGVLCVNTKTVEIGLNSVGPMKDSLNPCIEVYNA